jgi:hypothetical protein
MTLVPLSEATIARREAAVHNEAFSGGIKDGGDFLPALGLRGRQFRIKSGGQEVNLDNRTLEVILVTGRPTLSKAYYEGKFEPGTVKKPACQSVDGIRPDASVANPIAPLCATCRMNAWGSRKNEQTGRDAKACNDVKMLILAPPTLEADEKPLQVLLATGSQKTFIKYIKLLTHNGLAGAEVVTRLGFTDDAFPKLTFDYVRNLTSDEAVKVAEIAKREDVTATLAISAEQAPAEVTATQPTTVANVPPVQTAPAAPPQAPAEVVDDRPSDEITNVLSRWGASPAK